MSRASHAKNCCYQAVNNVLACIRRQRSYAYRMDDDYEKANVCGWLPTSCLRRCFPAVFGRSSEADRRSVSVGSSPGGLVSVSSPPPRCTSLAWKPVYWGSSIAVVASLYCLVELTGLVETAETGLGPVGTPMLSTLLSNVSQMAFRATIEDLARGEIRRFCHRLCGAVPHFFKAVRDNPKSITAYLFLVAVVGYFVESPADLLFDTTTGADLLARTETFFDENITDSFIKTYGPQIVTLTREVALVNGFFSTVSLLIDKRESILSSIGGGLASLGHGTASLFASAGKQLGACCSRSTHEAGIDDEDGFKGSDDPRGIPHPPPGVPVYDGY